MLLLFFFLILQHLLPILVFVFHFFFAQARLGLPLGLHVLHVLGEADVEAVERHIHHLLLVPLAIIRLIERQLLQQLTRLHVHALRRIDRNRQFYLEEFILEALAGRRPLLRIILQHVLYKLDGVGRGVLDDGAEVLRQVLRKPIVQLCSQLESLRPGNPTRRTKHFANASHLVVLGLAGE